MYTPRFNPNSAVSNWKGRLDFLKGYPGAQMMGALNGGFFGGAEITGGVRNDSMGDGYLYETFAASGTMTVSGNMTVDMLVVGGGGGYNHGANGGQQYWGGAGGGGVTSVVDLDVEAGDYTVTIGALGSNGASQSGMGTNGGSTEITIGGVLISGGGGGRAGWGGPGYCEAGAHGDPGVSTTSPNRGSGGSGGGAGIWVSYCGAAASNGGGAASAGTPPSGTFTIWGGGNGAASQYYNSGGGGGGSNVTNGIVGRGADGISWNNFPTSSSWYGQGANTYDSTTYPAGRGATTGIYGRGSSGYQGNGVGGVVIVRWAA